MSERAKFETALAAVRDWHATLPGAAAFCPWPGDLTWQTRPAHIVPAADLLLSDPGAPGPASSRLCAALQALALQVEWRHSYTAGEVGQDFLDRYGWFELAGPEGHYVSQEARITVGYWGPGLFYPRHQHEPEELYTIVAGRGHFHADGEADVTLGPGDTKFHRTSQPHALTTTGAPILTLVFWRGDRLNDALRLSA